MCIWVILLAVSAGLVVLGVKALASSGLAFSRHTTLSGTPAKVVGLVCILAGVGLIPFFLVVIAIGTFLLDGNSFLLKAKRGSLPPSFRGAKTNVNPTPGSGSVPSSSPLPRSQPAPYRPTPQPSTAQDGVPHGDPSPRRFGPPDARPRP